MLLHIPNYMPGWDTGQQVFNPGEGGPASHMGLQATQPRSYPTVYAITTYGLGAMPRQVIGPTMPTVANNLSNPMPINNLEILGLFKSPVGP